ncbi:hypothetical protein [Acinetobacter tianfuensis]|uniref:Uncharacterized protein n=1 Tax=Acinetobacter tianfuensis TaxID=2419603 RepID=A0A3A8EDA5_9GAMM|nr:hypothetical protein [Acinetobacter tianfuensis]RKG32605.1 hypothetical protein D7V32_05280 [Acinetobacter tianfuensis]
MIQDIQVKYEQLSSKQKEMFAGYGLRQIKHFVDISLPKIEAALPQGARVQGINADGKVIAYNPGTKEYLIWISDLQWQRYTKADLAVDMKEDAMAIWQVFGLKNYELIDLSHVHRDFLENQTV